MARDDIFGRWALAASCALAATPAEAAGIFDPCFALHDAGDTARGIECLDAVESPPPVKAFFKAEMLEALGQPANALAHYEAYLETGDEGFAGTAREARQRLEQSVRGRLDIRCAPVGAEARISGRAVGTCPTVTGLLEPGTHRVEVRIDGERVSAEDATVHGGRTTTCCRPPPPVTAGDWAPWTLIGVGAAGLTAGVFLNLEHHDRFEALAQRVADGDPTLSGLSDAEKHAIADDVVAWRDGSHAAYAVGAALMAAGAGWAVWELLGAEPRAEPRAAVEAGALEVKVSW